MQPTTVYEATSAYLRERRKRGELSIDSERGYRARLDDFAHSVGAEREAARLQRRHIETWLDTFDRLAPTSRRAYFTTARLFCRWLRDRKVIDVDLFDGLKPPREPKTVPRALPPDMIRRVLAECDDRQRVCAILMLQLGLRRGEVARLRVEHVDFFNRVALVNGKGKHERMVPLPAQAATELRSWLGSQRITSGPVIRSRTSPDKGLCPATIGNLMVSAMYAAEVKQCGWDRVTGHSFRHSALTDMLRHGAHIRDVQRVAGHVSVATTETYLPLVVNTLEDAVEGRSY